MAVEHRSLVMLDCFVHYCIIYYSDFNMFIDFKIDIISWYNSPLSGTTLVSWYLKGKTNLDFTEARDITGTGIIWAIRKSAPHSRQITTPAPHHSVFYRPDALPAAQPTVSKH